MSRGRGPRAGERPPKQPRARAAHGACAQRPTRGAAPAKWAARACAASPAGRCGQPGLPSGRRAPGLPRASGGSAGARATLAEHPPSVTAVSLAAMELLKDVHLGLAPPCPSPARLALLSGHYLYYHYGCDGLDDRGWGCGYRTLQTLCSWPEGQSTGVPGLVAVQAALEDMGDKPPGFQGSRSWIGCVEASLCLAYFGGPQGRLCHVPRGAGLRGELERLYSHFAGGGGPVMVGGDADARAKALLGVCEGPDSHAYVLILDPHCWGTPKNPSELQAAQWVGWQEVSTAFDPNSFYNLCLTSRN
uniref:inactive Ufm1-specific protease 1 n=1 Tax=Jaculus jaculus TaxID=51337 RepID=UPI001E1AFE1F|nr:inactive Ufm1-specific protease 1 [Jaculus jaculus]